MKSCHMVFVALLTKLNCSSSLCYVSKHYSGTKIQFRRSCQLKSGNVEKHTVSTNRKVCILNPQNPEYKQIAENIAKDLDISLLTNEDDDPAMNQACSFCENFIHRHLASLTSMMKRWL